MPPMSARSCNQTSHGILHRAPVSVTDTEKNNWENEELRKAPMLYVRSTPICLLTKGTYASHNRCWLPSQCKSCWCGSFNVKAFANRSNHCYVAICDRRNLWRCRNLWLKLSQFVTGVAICDGKCRNLWQRQNMQFNDIYSLNFDKYFLLSSYLY